MTLRIIIRNMSSLKLINNAEKTEKRLAELKAKLEDVKKYKVEEKVKHLTQDNKSLITQVEKAKAELIRLETLNGKKQYPLPGKTKAIVEQSNEKICIKDSVVKKEKKEKEVKNSKEKLTGVSNTESVIDIRKLDLRIGKIVEINKHPDADSLYVEKIDCGEENPRTVVSGLVNHVPIEEMKERIVMVLCNLKPVKMRGVTSEAMVMCASTPEKVEVLTPPNGATPGDLVLCEGYPREPETQMNPKKKIFETCAPDLRTNDDGVACYKGSPLTVYGKGPITAATLKGVYVK